MRRDKLSHGFLLHIIVFFISVSFNAHTYILSKSGLYE